MAPSGGQVVVVVVCLAITPRLDQEYMTYYHTHLAEARTVLAIKSHTQTHTHAYIGFLLLLRQCYDW